MEARYRGGAKFYPGVIARSNRDGSCDIDYDDGEKEKDVKRSLIEKLGGGSGGAKMKRSPRGGGGGGGEDSSDAGGFSRGDKVEARYRGGAKFYPGKIVRDNRDGTFDIDYDDGEKEKDVKERLIKKLKGGGGGMKHSPRGGADSETGTDGTDGGSLSRGDKVEARYRGGAKFYPGKIVRDNRDGTFDIDYDDGEKEKDVKERLIKKLKDTKKKSNNASDTEADDDSLSRGDKVEARYRGGGKFYPGKIVRDNRDGTFDIDYDDGEKEKDVKKRLINKIKDTKKKSNNASDTEADDSLSRGDKVEARYRGGGKFYPGKIVRDNRDGTFDID